MAILLQARKEVALATFNKAIYCQECDLASQESIRRFAERIQKSGYLELKNLFTYAHNRDRVMQAVHVCDWECEWHVGPCRSKLRHAFWPCYCFFGCATRHHIQPTSLLTIYKWSPNNYTKLFYQNFFLMAVLYFNLQLLNTTADIDILKHGWSQNPFHYVDSLHNQQLAFKTFYNSLIYTSPTI